MEIGKKLKNARVQSGMTQENVAEKINVSRQTISNWENEKSYPDIISVIELSNLYSISLDVLLKGDEKNDWTFRRKYKCCKKQPKNDMGNYCKYHCRSIADNIKYVYTR